MVVLVVAMLAVSSGALLAAFAIVDTSLLRNLPYPHADRIVEVWPVDTRTGNGAPYVDERILSTVSRTQGVFDATAAYAFEGVTITRPGPAEVVAAAQVSPNLLALLGAVPLRGRLFVPEDADAAAEPAVIVAESVWTARFAGTPGGGARLVIDGVPHRVVGVLPAGWAFPESSTAIWRPIRSVHSSGRAGALMIGVLQDGMTRANADARLRVLSSRLRAAGILGRQTVLATMEPLQRKHNRQYATGLYAVLAGATLLHLVACFNVVNLLLARTSSRRRELAVSAALGATTSRLVWSVLVETALLAGAGFGCGLALSIWILRALVLWIPPEFTWLTASQPAIDGRVLVFMIVAGAASWVVVSALPAIAVLRLDVAEHLQRAASTHTGSRSQALHAAMVSLQIAGAVVLLTTGGLLVTSFLRLVSVDPGFRVPGLVVLEIQFPQPRYQSSDARQAFIEELRRRVEAMAYVVRATHSNGVPPRGGELSFDIHPEADGDPVEQLAGLECPPPPSQRTTST